MQLVPGSTRIVADPGADPLRGIVQWAPAKSIWIGSMTLSALVLGPIFFTPAAFLLFLATSAVTLCAGHSVGMHRRLIHSSFQCPLWLEYVCVYLGVLVGMARCVATAPLRPCPRITAEVSAGRAACGRSRLLGDRTQLDVAAAAMGNFVLRGRRHAMAGVGYLRSSGSVRHRPLAGRAFRTSRGRSNLARRGRRSPRFRHPYRRPDQHG
jgi:hypothetical protein